VKKYEGLFILDTAGKEETVKDVIDKVSSEITAAGGRIETVQKMDKKQFARARYKKHTAGFYVNIIFEIDPQKLPALKSRFTLNNEVFRVLFSVAPEANALQAAAAAAPAGAR
jgi:small subunit ribosomal protein S6